MGPIIIDMLKPYEREDAQPLMESGRYARSSARSRT